MLIAVKEYAAKIGVSPSTVQRRLQRGELKGRRFGRVWYVEVHETLTAANSQPTSDITTENNSNSNQSPMLQELISFSSKALNSYLLMSDQLIIEKERAYKEKAEQLQSERQRVAELEAYVKLLESQLFSDRGANRNSSIQGRQASNNTTDGWVYLERVMAPKKTAHQQHNFEEDDRDVAPTPTTSQSAS